MANVFLSRRNFLAQGSGVIGAVMGAAFVPGSACAFVLPRKLLGERRLHLHNTHTGEFFNRPYWEKGKYIESALRDLNVFFRDHRTNDVIAMKVQLLDLIHGLQQKLDYKQALDVICGFRSAATNRMLRAKSSGVAKKSLHLVGAAVDLRFRGLSLARAYKAACALGAGGVGLYPQHQDRFIHIDVRSRAIHWTG